MEHLFGLGLICLAIFGILYVYLTNKTKEKLAIIQAGLEPKTYQNQSKSSIFYVLIIGFVAIGIAIGVGSGYLIELLIIHINADEIAKIKIDSPYFKPKYEVPYIFSIFLCGGISLILAFYNVRKMYRKNNNQ